MPQSPTPDKDYYEKLSGMSPAAPAPPACVREHPSVAGSEDGKSVATSWISGRSTPRSDRELHPSPTAAEVAALHSDGGWERLAADNVARMQAVEAALVARYQAEAECVAASMSDQLKVPCDEK
jgi:hypothetical protein